MAPKLTIGIPTYNDADGLYFTIQCLRIFHSEFMNDVEFVVIDQSPLDSPHASAVKNFMNYVHKTKPCTHVTMPKPQGSSAAKNAIFHYAKGEIVLCIDSHVIMWPGSLEAILKTYEDPIYDNALLVGPMIYDDLLSGSTNLVDIWSSEQWGIWGSTALCNTCTKIVGYYLEDEVIYTYDPETRSDNKGKGKCYNCNYPLNHNPTISLESSLLNHNFIPIIRSSDYPLNSDIDKLKPYKVWAHGTGLMVCKKKHWQGFAPGVRFFGAEEVIIHDIHRNYVPSSSVYCVPKIRWTHKFLKTSKPTFNLSRYERMRNFLMGTIDLGLPISLVYDHFCSLAIPKIEGLTQKELIIKHLLKEHTAFIKQSKEELQLMTEEALAKLHQDVILSDNLWLKALLDNPESPEPLKIINEDNSMKTANLHDWYNHASNVKSDINEHCATLKEYASMSNRVTEFGTRHGVSTIALLYGLKPNGRLVSYDKAPSHEATLLKYIVQGQNTPDKFNFLIGDSTSIEIENTDLLFIDTLHTANHLSKELNLHHKKVSSWIILHDTVTYGIKGEGNEIGLLYALEEFIEKHPEWFVEKHFYNNNGLTILSKLSERKPETPIILWKHLKGAGTELKNILASLGIHPSLNCDCNTRMQMMNHWGVEVCKINRQEIISWVKSNAKNWGWTSLVIPLGRSILNGLVFRLNPFDPIPSIVDEAIRRAEIKEKK